MHHAKIYKQLSLISLFIIHLLKTIFLLRIAVTCTATVMPVNGCDLIVEMPLQKVRRIK